MAVLAGSGVNMLEVLRDVGVGVEAVNYVETLSQCGRLFGQIGGRAAAEQQYVDLVLVAVYLVDGAN